MTGVHPPEPPQVYVQIPAYRDRELSRTLLDLYRQASHPERLRVGVLWQRDRQEHLPAPVYRLPRLELIEVPYARSRGCNWARRLLQERWQGEPYTLMLDSHHRFVRDWDDQLIDMHQMLRRRGVARPVVTAYLPAYDPAREPGARRKRPYKIYPLGREDGLLTKLTSYPLPGWTTLTAPVEAEFVSLHFLFVEGDFNRAVPMDPRVYFFGDEVLTSLRAYTAGYDLFHPHRVLGWHSYDRATRVAHWSDHPRWHLQHQRTLDLLRQVYSGHAHGRSALGVNRSVHQYEEHIMTRLIESPERVT